MAPARSGPLTRSRRAADARARRPFTIEETVGASGRSSSSVSRRLHRRDAEPDTEDEVGEKVDVDDAGDEEVDNFRGDDRARRECDPGGYSRSARKRPEARSMKPRAMSRSRSRGRPRKMSKRDASSTPSVRSTAKRARSKSMTPSRSRTPITAVRRRSTSPKRRRVTSRSRSAPARRRRAAPRSTAMICVPAPVAPRKRRARSASGRRSTSKPTRRARSTYRGRTESRSQSTKRRKTSPSHRMQRKSSARNPDSACGCTPIPATASTPMMLDTSAVDGNDANRLNGGCSHNSDPLPGGYEGGGDFCEIGAPSADDFVDEIEREF